jgi:hypothetical protein
MHMFPITNEGEFPLDNHHKWVAQRRMLEWLEDDPTNGEQEEEEGAAKEDERAAAIVPGRHDIILGRHWEAQLHAGNMRFRDIVATHWERYDKAIKRQKTEISAAVVEELKTSGGRFLRSDGAAGYVLVDDTVAREKASNAFRDRRKIVIADEKRKAGEI